jgi:hypothetical protein
MRPNDKRAQSRVKAVSLKVRCAHCGAPTYIRNARRYCLKDCQGNDEPCGGIMVDAEEKK